MAAAATGPLETELRHEQELARYTLWQDGQTVGLVDYRVTPSEVRFVHTEVDPARRGQGLAGRLIEFALDDVHATTDRRVVADCPYVGKWIDDHAEYQDLLTRGG